MLKGQGQFPSDVFQPLAPDLLRRNGIRVVPAYSACGRAHLVKAFLNEEDDYGYFVFMII
ncbi:MAG: hypothetical protein A3J24_10885 [Deltaproteobacteria bacterium RIFCSPLOWO2_02_FULL_53_8]|jgi:hypothetical protein|nr:MAG: hypothetical protein A3J24_10885 [Deltaproteobacteria bacterium RIFCSPLOWO2_02_FULL_53_8]